VQVLSFSIFVFGFGFISYICK